jgi:hypothetical protein
MPSSGECGIVMGGERGRHSGVTGLTDAGYSEASDPQGRMPSATSAEAGSGVLSLRLDGVIMRAQSA